MYSIHTKTGDAWKAALRGLRAIDTTEAGTTAKRWMAAKYYGCTGVAVLPCRRREGNAIDGKRETVWFVDSFYLGYSYCTTITLSLTHISLSSSNPCPDVTLLLAGVMERIRNLLLNLHRKRPRNFIRHNRGDLMPAILLACD